MTPGVVVKVGGSLFDHPNLGPGLRAYCASFGEPVTLVAGGGAFADAVRALDAVHRLGEDAAHRVALESLRASAAFVRHLVGGAAEVLDVPAFLAAFERANGPVPASWAVTTDSLAGYAAGSFGCRLVLLKSADVSPGWSWDDAAAAGAVDEHFPKVVARFGLTVEVRNFRRVLDGSRPAAGRPLG